MTLHSSCFTLPSDVTPCTDQSHDTSDVIMCTDSDVTPCTDQQEGNISDVIILTDQSSARMWIC